MLLDGKCTMSQGLSETYALCKRNHATHFYWYIMLFGIHVHRKVIENYIRIELEKNRDTEIVIKQLNTNEDNIELFIWFNKICDEKNTMSGFHPQKWMHGKDIR